MSEQDKDPNQEVKDQETKFKKLRDVIVWISNHRYTIKILEIAAIFFMWLFSTIGYVRYTNRYFFGYEQWIEVLENYPGIIYNLLLLHTTLIIMIASVSGLIGLLVITCAEYGPPRLAIWVTYSNKTFTLLVVLIGLVLFINSSDIFKEIIEVATQDYDWIKQ